MLFTLLIAAFGAILLVIVAVTALGAIGRGVARREEAPDPTIADSRDGFDPK